MKRALNILVFLVVGALVSVIFLQVFINQTSAPYIKSELSALQPAYTGIVLGASVRPDKSLSPILKDRVDAALKAYRLGTIKRFLLSGDHGQADYDEVNAMKIYLNDRGVPDGDIFLDHAGFDTYDSMIRAHSIYQVNDAIVFTQSFHQPRAIFLGRHLGINLQGYAVDPIDYSPASSLQRREWLANVKAWIEIHIEQRPTFEGDATPITGDSSLTHDQ